MTGRRQPRGAGGVATLALCLFALACTESGQILGAIDTAQGGMPADGTGGESPGPGTGGQSPSNVAPGPTGETVAVDGGDLHTCAVVDGALYCWGDNQTGALGLGDFEARTLATRVGSESGWTAVGSGDGFSCGILSGSVYCWGRGSSGQLGTGQFTQSAVPVSVALPGPAEKIGVGLGHACVILNGGSLYCWGQNTEGQLAQSDPWTGPGVNSGIPLEVAPSVPWSMVAAGQGHTCAIQMDGSLWCWGRNSRRELGQGPDQSDQIRAPGIVGDQSDWVYVSAGQHHTCAIRNEQLYCWGDNSHNQLGFMEPDVAADPTLVPGVPSVRSVSVDTFHTCAIDAAGMLRCWGRNIEGQLGDGTVDLRVLPTDALPQGNWDAISAGRFHTCGVRAGAILCAGDNAPGRLGTGDTERSQQFSPTYFLAP